MNETVKNIQTSDNPSTKIAFWGTLGHAVVLLLLSAIVLYQASSGQAITGTTTGLSQTTFIYIVTALVAVMTIMNAASLVFTIRGNGRYGFGLTFFSMVVLLLSMVSLLQGRALFMSFFIVVLATVGIIWLCPPQSRRFYIITTAVTFSLTWIIEWINPPWRMAYNGVQAGPIAAIVFTVIFILLLARQAWRGNIRTKLVTAFTAVALIAIGIVGIGSYISYQNQIRADIRQRLLNVISITALQQDADLHASIQTPEDQQLEAYQQMQAVNRAILATDLDLAYIFSVRVDEQGTLTFVIDSGLEEGYDPVDVGVVYDDPSALLAQNAATLDHPIVEQDFYTDQYGTFLSAYAPIYNKDGIREGIVGVDIRADKVLEQENAALFRIMVITMIALALVAGIGLYLGNLFTRPILNLSAMAQQVAEGNLNVQAEVETTDEIGALASTFNNMTRRLRQTLEGLEERVAERTRNLELAAEIGRTVSQVRSLDVMLTEAAELIRKQFDLYYVQVYLTNRSQTYLTLQAGTGDVGRELLEREHRLPFNTNSLNGRAAVERKSVVIANTSKSVTFKPNPLLPNTRSEMAVPLLVGDKVVGVLDMQSTYEEALNNEVLPAFEALAGQIAIAIQNSTYLAETQQARIEVEAQARRLIRTNWEEYLDAIHEPEHKGFVFEKNQVVPLTEIEGVNTTEENTLVVPISITGEPLGSFVVEMEEQTSNIRSNELIEAVARQVAQQIEGIRLLESAERYRADAEQAARRLTREGWKTYTDSTEENLSYLYDLTEVRPVTGDIPQNETTTIPLKVREEVIGSLAIQGLDTDNKEAVDLANAVADRLGTHIEALRLFEQTEQRRTEAENLVRELDVQKYALDQHSIVAITDVTGKITYVNDKFVEISKYSREELLGQDHRILNSGHHPKEFMRNLWVTIANGKVFHNEIRNKAKDGALYWVDTTIVPILNAQGKPERYLAIRTDVTERKHNEEVLEQRRAEAEALVRELDVQKYALDQHSIVAITDVTGKITYANDKFVEISKYSREELIGQDHRLLNSGYHSKEFIRNLWVTIANGKVFHGELRNRAKDGSIYWVDTTIVPLLNAEGKPERYLAIRTDITQRKLDEEVMEKRAKQLASVAEISTISSQELDIHKMLESVVHLTQRRFGLYHAHVFIFDDAMQHLAISACGWKEGDEHEGTHGTTAIPLAQEQSLVARAARTRKSVIVNDVHNEPGWLPNPLLPDTASELAVPMIVGDQLLGVMDVQSDKIGAFTEEDANIQTTLASQVATALQNAQSFSKAQLQAERESALNIISQKIQSATTVEAVLQIAARELGHALGAPVTVAQLSMKDSSS